jgi:hypothetical protein
VEIQLFKKQIARVVTESTDLIPPAPRNWVVTLPPSSDLTRLNPKVTDIVFVATFKVILKPLVRKIPGFGECFKLMGELVRPPAAVQGSSRQLRPTKATNQLPPTPTAHLCTSPAAAIALALKGPPIINYRLNFGQLSGGSVTTAPITTFVNFIVKEVLVGMLVWPKRITVRTFGRREVVGWSVQLWVARLPSVLSRMYLLTPFPPHHPHPTPIRSRSSPLTASSPPTTRPSTSRWSG